MGQIFRSKTSYPAAILSWTRGLILLRTQARLMSPKQPSPAPGRRCRAPHEYSGQAPQEEPVLIGLVQMNHTNDDGFGPNVAPRLRLMGRLSASFEDRAQRDQIPRQEPRGYWRVCHGRPVRFGR
jgi:hypothetical protein